MEIEDFVGELGLGKFSCVRHEKKKKKTFRMLLFILIYSTFQDESCLLWRSLNMAQKPGGG